MAAVKLDQDIIEAERKREQESNERLIRSSESHIACNLAKVRLFDKTDACLGILFNILTNLNELLKQEVNKPKR